MSRERTTPPEQPPQTLSTLGRELSAWTLLFHQTAAERLGLGPSDHKSLDLLMRGDEAMTPGKLAELTGLTTGAITGVLDRLERGGFVRREKDPHDRRQLTIRVLPGRAADLASIFDPFAASWQQLSERFTPGQLETIQAFMNGSIELLKQHTRRLQEEAQPAPAEDTPDSELSAPLAGATRGRLEFPEGVSDLTIRAARGRALYQASFEGPRPTVTASGGKVQIDYKRSVLRALGLQKHRGQLALNDSIPWKIVCHEGATRLDADLRGLRVSGVELREGVADSELRLPPPEGTVPVHIKEGASNLRVLRPHGAAVRVQIGEGASQLTIDTLQLGAVGGGVRWASPDYAAATDRYDIQIGEGASDLEIATLPAEAPAQHRRGRG